MLVVEEISALLNLEAELGGILLQLLEGLVLADILAELIIGIGIGAG